MKKFTIRCNKCGDEGFILANSYDGCFDDGYKIACETCDNEAKGEGFAVSPEDEELST